MTSINLISPIDKASDFSVRFRDPITIGKNSKVYLNYAHLSRLNEVRFSQDQTITLTDLNFIPRVQPHDGVTPITLQSNSITIPVINPLTKRNGYKVSELEDLISTKLTELIGNNPELSIYSAVFNEQNNINKNQSHFQTGLFLGSVPYTEFSIDADNSRDADTGLADADSIEHSVYLKSSPTAANPHYDSYALGETHFMHFSVPCKEDVYSSSYIKLKTNINMNTQQGNISFGLYSKELADHPNAFDGWAEKTTGDGATTGGGALNNPAIFAGNTQLNAGTATAANLKKATLGSFLTIEITGVVNAARNTSQLKISVPSFNTNRNNTVKLWDSINKEVRQMVTVFSTPLRRIFGDAPNALDNPFECFILFYQSTHDNDYLSETDRKIYFKIFKDVPQNQDINKLTPIYDSKKNDIFYPQSFFTGLGNLNTGTAGQIKAKVESSIPFVPIASAQVQREGFIEISYAGFLKNAGGATNQNPNTILTTYKMNFSDQLGDVVGALNTNILYPNVCENNTRFHYFEDVVSSWKNDSFDVYLNGLPIKNYKNTENSSDGGFSKPLLCSIPVPFLFGNSNEGMGVSDSVLTGLYQPSIKNVLKLNNQEKIINSLSVQIKDTNTEEPATELRQAHISFTITDDENEIKEI